MIMKIFLWYFKKSCGTRLKRRATISQVIIVPNMTSLRNFLYISILSQFWQVFSFLWKTNFYFYQEECLFVIYFGAVQHVSWFIAFLFLCKYRIYKKKVRKFLTLYMSCKLPFFKCEYCACDILSIFDVTNQFVAAKSFRKSYKALWWLHGHRYCID